MLFGWSPADLRAPFQAHALQSSPADSIDAWLKLRMQQLSKAKVSLEYARQAVLRAHKKSAHSRQHHVGDQVKVSTAHLVPRAATAQSAKLQPRYVGPFLITEQVNPGAFRLKLPESNVAVHDVFNESQLRPWFDKECFETLSPDELPAVVAHPTLNKIVQVFDRKKCGTAPGDCDVVDMPTQYVCVRRGGSSEWVPDRHLEEPEDRKLLKEFEWRFPLSKELPCDSVKNCPVEKYADEAAWESDDEVDLGLADDLDQRFG